MEIEVAAAFFMIFGAHISIFIIKVKFFVFIKFSSRPPQVMLIIEPRINSFKHMFFWYSFLESHQNIGVRFNPYCM